MSTEIERIVGELRREFDGDPWHGPSLKTLLEGVTAREAGRRPLDAAHSIWELVLHMTSWKREVASRLRGNAAAEPAAGDWPAVGRVTEARWRAAVADLARAQRELVGALRAVAPRRLDARVPDSRGPSAGPPRTVYQTVQGLIQHDLYHMGQVAILRKARRSRLPV